MNPLPPRQRGTGQRRQTGGERRDRSTGRRYAALAAPWPAERPSWVPRTPRDREVERQIGRLLDVFPDCRYLMQRMLECSDPRTPHDDRERAYAAALAEVLTALLRGLSDAYGDTRPAISFNFGGKPCDRAT